MEITYICLIRNQRPNIYKSWCLNSTLIPNNSDLIT